MSCQPHPRPVERRFGCPRCPNTPVNGVSRRNPHHPRKPDRVDNGRHQEDNEQHICPTEETHHAGVTLEPPGSEGLKWLKDGYVVSVKPFWVWHHAKVAGHTVLCVMRLLLLRYLQWELRELDLPFKELVKELEKIRVAVVMLNKKPGWVLEEMGLGETELVSRLKLLDEIPTPV